MEESTLIQKRVDKVILRIIERVPAFNIDALDLTIAIPVKNEEVNLSRCLSEIGEDLARHVVVIDSGSTDNTRQIAKSFGAEVIDFVWNGRFPKKRNWFLRNYSLQTKWVLFLDADEYLTPQFKSELKSTLANSDKAGYWLSYSVYFLGKKLKGGYPLRKLALFQVGVGEYENIDEHQWSELDMEVHEHPIVKGEVGVIKSKIDHQDFRGTAHFILKHNEYASWEAARFLKAEGINTASKKWTKKQLLKYYLMRSIFIVPLFFFGSFFFYRGFRDGARGFAHAVLKMSYYMQIYCKIRESRNL
ncbi:MAG: glycosyl transferase family 2 [Mucilaginibacter sp.]|nr:glycosyl transferase family 2 [Mucilaginibacter sp.]